MTALIVFIGLIVGLNCIPLLTKANFPQTQKAIIKLLAFSTILFLTISILAFNGYRLKGQFAFLAISLTFIGLTIIYFALFKNTTTKILTTIFLLTPLLALSVSTLLFEQVLKEFDINDNTKIIVTTGGFWSCGEMIYFTQTKFGFDKEVHYESGLCLRGIEKIEIVKIDTNHAEFLIYHDKTMDSENPFKYDVERKNGW